MLKFIFKYSVWLSLLFLLIHFESYSPLYFLNAWQTQITIYLTYVWVDVFNIPVQMLGNSLYFSHGLKLVILDECNSMLPLLMFISGVLAYPSDCHNKIYWMTLGYFVVSIVNLARIYLVTYIVLDNASHFHLAHDYLGRFLILVTTFLLFYTFVRTVGIMFRSKCFNNHKSKVKKVLN